MVYIIAVNNSNFKKSSRNDIINLRNDKKAATEN